MPHAEGDTFAVPLDPMGGFGIGVIARTGRNIVLAYFFDIHIATIEQWQKSKPSIQLASGTAIWIRCVGDLGLIEGTWPLIGKVEPWIRSEWPVPDFARSEEFSGRAYRVVYGDAIGSTPVEMPATAQELAGLPEDGLAGAGFAEARLSQLLRERGRDRR